MTLTFTLFLQPFQIVGPEMIQEKYGMDQDVSTNNDHDNASMNFLKVKLGNDDSVAPAEIKKDEDDNADDTRLNTIDDAEAKQNVPPGPSALVDYSEANYDGILCNVPLAGDKKEEHKSNVLDVEDQTKQPHQSTRNVTNSCPICLSRFEDGEQLCWSGNPECLHVVSAHLVCLSECSIIRRGLTSCCHLSHFSFIVIVSWTGCRLVVAKSSNDFAESKAISLAEH